MTFATLIEGFKGFFSRSFWFASFLPVALICAAHAALAATLFGLDAGSWIDKTISAAPGRAVVIFVGLVILAYAIGPLTPLFTGILDGSLLPAWLHDRLRRERAGKWRQEAQEYRDALGAVARAEKLSGEPLKRLQNARAFTEKPTTNPKDLDIAGKVAAIHEAAVAIGDVEKTANEGWDQDLEAVRSIDLETLAAAMNLLASALERNTAAIDAPAMTEAKAAVRQVTSLLREARGEASHRFQAVIRRLPNFDPQDWQPTRVGDARYRRERYVRDTYGVSFGYLWPRVRMAVATGEDSDGKGLPRQVADAAAQVDFAVLLLVLACTLPLVWLPLILLLNKSVWAFVAIGLLTPPVTRLLYELVVRSEMAFGGVMQTAVDRYRLSVLPLLAMPLPPTLSAERDLWSRLARSSVAGASVELVYAHPKQAGQ